MTDANTLDSRGLIREAYRIEGIGLPECRAIFFDWAMGLPVGTDEAAAAAVLLAAHGADAPDHPMTAVLREALAGAAAPAGRRGGRRRRRSTDA